MKNKFICRVDTDSENQTLDLGELVGKLVKPGDTLCLTGDLGSGKTVLARGIAKGMGIIEPITSPTFTLLNVYECKIPLYHFDVYRLDDESMVQDIGYSDYIGADGVAVIEWADLIVNELPDSFVLLEVKRDFESGDDKRIIHVYLQGDKMKCVTDGIKNWRYQNDNISG